MDAAEGLERLIAGAGVDAAAGERLRVYLRLLLKWNARLNLTGRTDWEGLGPHFGEGVWAAALGRWEPALHLDIGSGAGFPALPMAALRPRGRFELVEARARRCVFLEVAARELGLTGVRVCQLRLSDYLAENAAGGWDRVSWKGVRLGARDADGLLRRGAPGVEFWLFHGRELPVEEPEAWLRAVRLTRRVSFPGKAGWFLSIYRRQPDLPVSRETS